MNIVEWKWYRFYIKAEKNKETAANKCVGRALGNQRGFETPGRVIPLADCYDIREIEDPFADDILLNKEAAGILSEIRARVWVEACYDPTSEHTQRFATQLLDKFDKLKEHKVYL